MHSYCCYFLSKEWYMVKLNQPLIRLKCLEIYLLAISNCKLSLTQNIIFIFHFEFRQPMHGHFYTTVNRLVIYWSAICNAPLCCCTCIMLVFVDISAAICFLGCLSCPTTAVLSLTLHCYTVDENETDLKWITLKSSRCRKQILKFISVQRCGMKIE